MKKFAYAVLSASLVLLSCNEDDKKPTDMETEKTNPPMVTGLNYSKSKNAFDASYTNLETALKANDNIKVIAEIDHQANAKNVNIDLNPTKLIIFGNPNLGTALMQKNQLAALDLPQKILVYQNDLKETFLAYNNTAHLISRHDLTGIETLPTIAKALENFTKKASDSNVAEAARNTIANTEGIVTKESMNDFDTTSSIIENALNANEKIKIIANIDHSANAKNANIENKELRPTRLFIFGNPELGSPLMKNTQTTAIDLPQKMLVWENADGKVNISYNSPNYLKVRHNISENQDVLDKITGALETISSKAAAVPTVND